MPELPEVETIRRTLEPCLIGRAVERVEVLRPKQLGNVTPADLERRLVGRRIEGVGRRGKYLLVHLEGGEVLVFHLRMTGRLIFYPEGAPVTPYTRLVLGLTSPAELHLHDVRSFAVLWLTTEDKVNALPGLAALGPEPLEPFFTPQELKAALAGRRSSIKSLLLNQETVAGLGNIYADEALFRAGINPLRPGNSLTPEEVNGLWRAIREVLEEAISSGGTSFRDYVDGRGRPGAFQTRLSVYGRKGEPCRRCGTLLVGARLGGRSTVYCPRCQPLS
ncbi:MAG: formamidopyrimidine-DNA glycosylase [Bacillota bacterium]|nr:formamidopyrimidine-DNA glycosylase [Bacillota bacterium]MDK2926152.1 formamidopyrimidine-DNA glycosylase [Bacillota bacterium]MDK2960090.1 formamidopyrimidine-DNA glycosylase [Bacillota bacterium]